MYYYGFGAYLLLHLIGWVVAIVLVIWVVRLIAHGGPGGYHFRDRNGRGRGGWGNKDALDILNERYAKGELTKDEYEARKKDILSH